MFHLANTWRYFLSKTILEGEIKDAKKWAVFHLIFKHSLNISLVFWFPLYFLYELLMSLGKADTKWRYFRIIVCKMSILGLEYPFKLVKPAFVNSNTHLKGLCESSLVHNVNNANCASLFFIELEKFLWMTRSQICLPSVISKVANNSNELWETVRLTSCGNRHQIKWNMKTTAQNVIVVKRRYK